MFVCVCTRASSCSCMSVVMGGGIDGVVWAGVLGCEVGVVFVTFFIC